MGLRASAEPFRHGGAHIDNAEFHKKNVLRIAENVAFS